MKVFFDTNVLIASVVRSHVAHARCYSALDQIHNGTNQGVISAHSLAEMYSILTKYPPPLRHTPEQALLSIEENVLKHFKTTSLSGNDYASLVRSAAAARILGGTIYDAILVKCADLEMVDQILTLNLKHFRAVAPKNLEHIIAEP